MGYRIVDPEDIEPAPDRPCELRRLTAAADLERMAMNLFRAEPGEQLPLAYHYHDEQEEAFYVLSGTMHVETPEGTHEVPEGGLFAVGPGDPQRAYNPKTAHETLVVLAVGAPPAEDDVHVYDPDEE
ncbi:cupin domain-containing protein [Halopenitus sp. H-Gu1]|uniref:cupin domain-containing protein n=1 Tax=Halopenitus sp. H-Gu1 TaxID=3242697 RepID=UPI00359E3DB6